MLERWGQFVVRHAKAILALAVLAAFGSVVASVNLPGRLSLDMFEHPGSDSYRGQRFLEEEFGVGRPNLVLVVTARSGLVDDPEVAREAGALEGRLKAERDVTDVSSYWSLGGAAPLRSRGGDRALVVARVLGDDRHVNERLGDLSPRYNQPGTTLDVRVGGEADALREILEQAVGEFKTTEIVTLPLTLIALLFVFGSVVAAALPLVIAIGATLGTMLGLWVLTHFTSITFFAPLFTSALALGLGIDYSLFIVSRFREEMAAGHDPDQALVRTLRTAGRTVLFSACAVTIALAGLLIVPIAFMRAFGFALILTGASAGIAALVVLPAVLVLLGPNVNRLTVWSRSARSEASGRWHRVAVAVMRRPVLVGGAIVAVLLVAGWPARRLDPGLVDDRDLPAESAGATTGRIIRTEFDVEAATPLSVVLPGTDAGHSLAELDAFARTIAGLPHVRVVTAPTGQYTAAGREGIPAALASRYQREGSAYLDVLTDAGPLTPESNRLIDTVRDLPSPFPSTLVTGEGAARYDVVKGMLTAIPGALAFIVVASGIVLFLQFGSLLVPLKAILLNGLSLTALFGGLVWAFQDGHLGGLLGFDPTGQLYIAALVLLVCLAFGLSMDYELFLLSRIKEEYDRTGDNDAAVATGLERSGRIVSAAAILIGVCFLSLGLVSRFVGTKLLGIGLAAVVLLDAFLIRGTLVPAFMKLAGEANWWAPRPLRRLHDRVGFSEHVDLDDPEPVGTRTGG